MKKVPNDVRLEKLDGHWAVFVVEDGHTDEMKFETEEFAKNFAAGQRDRLGLTDTDETKGRLRGYSAATVRSS